MATYTGVLRPSGVRATYLNISSTMDQKWETASHNPANIALALPNSVRTNKVWKITPHTAVIPRMFPNIYAPDNVMLWYQRRVAELPTANPTIWFRTVEPDWTITRQLVFPEKIWNVDSILVFINAATGPNEVWSWDATNLCFIVTVTPVGPPVVFGNFVVVPPYVPPPQPFANMTYVVEPFNLPGVGDSHVFDVLGLERMASILSSLPLSPNLVPSDPNTFDNLLGSNLSMRNALPLFDRIAHSYATWATVPYASPLNNQPNLAGPTVVNVAVSDLGDSSTVDAQTGQLRDIITSINLGDVEFGAFKERIVNDTDGEGIEYQAARNISNFKVSLLDTRNRQLTLPRNFPVFLRIQLIHSLD